MEDTPILFGALSNLTDSDNHNNSSIELEATSNNNFINPSVSTNPALPATIEALTPLQPDFQAATTSFDQLKDYVPLFNASHHNDKNELADHQQIKNDWSANPTKIAPEDSSWLKPNDLLAVTLKILYSVAYKFNDFLKEYDPYPQFPFPVVAANRGAAARAASSSMPSSFQTASSNSFSSSQVRMPAYEANNNFRRAGNDNHGWAANDNSPRAANTVPWDSRPMQPTAPFGQNSNPFFGSSFSTVAGNNNYYTASYTNPISTSPSNFYAGAPLAQPSAATSYSTSFSTPSLAPTYLAPSIPNYVNTPPVFSPAPSPFTSNSPIWSTSSSSPMVTPPHKVFTSTSYAPIVPTIQTNFIFSTPAMPNFDVGYSKHPSIATKAAEYAYQFARMQMVEPEPAPAPAPAPFVPPEGWVLGPGYILFYPELWQRNNGLPSDGWVLGPGYIMHHSIRTDYREAVMRAQVLKEISAMLENLFSNLYMNDIEGAKEHLRTILILHPELIYHILEGFKELPQESRRYLIQTQIITEALHNKAKAQAAKKAQAQTTSSSSGGGKDCDDPAAQAEFDKIPATLEESEGKGHKGHAQEMHVEWTLADFQERFLKEPDRDELSSFPDDATAEMAYQEVLRQAKKEICEWLSQPGNIFRNFHISFDKPIGYGLTKDETSTSPRYGARFRFVKTKDGPRVFTAYPIQ